MKTRRLLLVVLAFLTIATTSKLVADTVVLTQGAYSYDVGGEFTGTFTPPSTLYSQNYVAGVTSLSTGTFQTFCVETDVDFYPGYAYGYSVGMNSVGGAYAGPITEGVAYLYYEFARGTLAGYNYANTGPGLTRLQDAGLLQAAIWWLMGGQTYGGYTIPTVSNNPFYADAIDKFGADAIEEEGVGGQSYGVDVFQMYDIPGDPGYPGAAQAQLVLVPDGGSTLLMLGLAFTGLTAVGLRSRNLAA